MRCGRLKKRDVEMKGSVADLDLLRDAAWAVCFRLALSLFVPHFYRIRAMRYYCKMVLNRYSRQDLGEGGAGATILGRLFSRTKGRLGIRNERGATSTV